MRTRYRQWAKWLITGFVLSRAAGAHVRPSSPEPELRLMQAALYAHVDRHVQNLKAIKLLLATYETR